MLRQLAKRLQILDQTHLLVLAFGLLALLSIFSALASGFYFLVGVPIVLLVVYVALVDFSKLFYLLLFCLPLSTEVVLPGGFGTDLPTEPLMIGLMLITFIYFIRREHQVELLRFWHPITFLLLVHLTWIYISSITSNLLFVSLKFSLAKTWYIVVFYFLAGVLLKDIRSQQRFFWIIFLPLLFTVLVTMLRHAGSGFSFVGIHTVLHPFQRNHVNYAAMITLFMPFLWFAWRRQKVKSSTWWFLLGSIALMVLAIYLSYTRAAYIALLASIGAYFAFRLKMIRYLILAGIFAAVVGLMYMVQQNRYLEYAPNFDTTVTHYEFDNLVEATYKMEDISTMERLYRWVAGLKMSPEEPWVGFGPGNFVNFYRTYAVNNFETYVSDNPDNSGIHSYYLMVLVEQGIIGLVLFLLFSFFLLIKGEQIYHETKEPIRKGIAMSAILSLVVIDTFLLINDLIETDKIGPFFFLSAALLLNIDYWNRQQKKAQKE